MTGNRYMVYFNPLLQPRTQGLFVFVKGLFAGILQTSAQEVWDKQITDTIYCFLVSQKPRNAINRE